MPIYKKGQKNNLRSYRPLNLILIPGKVMELVILNVILWHMQDNQKISSSQQEFVKVRSCLTNLISFYDKVIYL